jgi:integrase
MTGSRRKTRLSEQDQWDIMPGNCTLLRTRPDGAQVWKLRLYAGLDAVSGRQLARSKTFEVPAGTKRIDARRAAEEALRNQIDDEAERVGTVADAVARYRRHRAALDSPSTIQGREARLARIESDLGRMRLDELKAHHLDDWYAKLRATTKLVKNKRTGKAERVRAMSELTIHHHHSQLRAVLRQAERWELVDRVATRNADAPPLTHRPVHPPTLRTLEAVLADAPADLETAAALLAGMGVRRGELMGLRWRDFHGKSVTVSRSIVEVRGGALQVKSTKTGRERTFRVGRDVIAVLRQHRDSQRAVAATTENEFRYPDGWVFADYGAGTPDLPRRPGWLSLAWARHCERHGARIRLHDLRHLHATMLLDAGVPVTAVSPRLGHLLISTTHDVYSHRVAESDALAAKVTGQALRRKPRPKALAAP